MKTKASSAKIQLLELMPPVCFYITYLNSDLIKATIGLILASLVVIFINKVFFKKNSKLVYFTTAVLVAFGGLTIFSGDVTFIKMKPTILYSLFALMVFVEPMFNNSFFNSWIYNNLGIEKKSARKISIRLTIFWIFLAVLNEFIWRNFDENTWVLLKTFGFTVLNILFCIYLFVKFTNPKKIQ